MAGSLVVAGAAQHCSLQSDSWTVRKFRICGMDTLWKACHLHEVSSQYFFELSPIEQARTPVQSRLHTQSVTWALNIARDVTKLCKISFNIVTTHCLTLPLSSLIFTINMLVLLCDMTYLFPSVHSTPSKVYFHNTYLGNLCKTFLNLHILWGGKKFTDIMVCTYTWKQP